MAYGTYQYGQQPYGWAPDEEAAPEITQFRILYAVATSSETVKFEYSEPPKRTAVDVLVSPYGKRQYGKQPAGGLYQDPFTLVQKSGFDIDNYSIISETETTPVVIQSIRSLTSTVFELTVSGMVSEINYTLVASEYIANDPGTTNLGETVAAIGHGNTAAFVGFGVHPYVVSVTNPSDGVLQVVFNEPMDVNFAFRNLSSYTVSPLANAPSLYLSGIAVNEATPDRVLLSFVGGGSQYALVVHGLVNLNGIYIASRPFYFTIDSYLKDELFDTTDYVFETNLGAVRLSMGNLTQRRIEDFAILRAQDVGYEAQFQNIARALDKAGITEQERVLKLFKR